MSFPNPFEEFVAAQFAEIRQTQMEILARFANTNFDHGANKDLVEIDEAASMVFLSKGRFYAIHKKYFTPHGQGRKRLFSRKELEAYNRRELQPLDNEAARGAEQFRVNRLNKKNDLRIA